MGWRLGLLKCYEDCIGCNVFLEGRRGELILSIVFVLWRNRDWKFVRQMHRGESLLYIVVGCG